MDKFYKIVFKNKSTAEKGVKLFTENGFNSIKLGRSIIFQTSVKETNRFITLMTKLNGYTETVLDSDIKKYRELQR